MAVGYGGSDPRPLPWSRDVLEQEAEIVVPALLEALNIDRPVLIGHSDGGTIAWCTRLVDRRPAATCHLPRAAIQGSDDEYGLPAQLDAIVDGVAGRAERTLNPDRAHDPHHQARSVVFEQIAGFVRSLSSGRAFGNM